MLGSTLTPKLSSVSLFRKTMRAVLALDAPFKEVLPEIEGTNVRDEKENLTVKGSTKVVGRNHPGRVAGGTDESCSTRGTRFHARLARLGCGAGYRKLECDG